VRAKNGVQGIERGESVFCSVRPESVQLKPAADSSDIPSRYTTNHLLAEVQSIMYLGDNEQYSLRLADGAIVRAVEYNPTTRKAQVGDRLALQFDTQAVVVLPQEELSD
jgi:ABC-type Fe3+/spermidine/putrescine transport system ATPase subunit